ncbi:MAG: tRNA uridine(34) 5-carboxymethylaminomethyl modification radical SAM/GNAT enzyme Elp3 [Candidatus Bathyarchaeia archaeon]
MDSEYDIHRAIVEELLRLPNPSKHDLDLLKLEYSRRYKLRKLPQNSEILRCAKPDEEERLAQLLRRKATRLISGVSVVAVMTAPWPCPHGRCAYCPGGPEENTPQSYTGFEPAAMRGAQNRYNPYRQVKCRIEQLEGIGHRVDKVEVVIMGGNFNSTPTSYQEWFIQCVLDAINNVPSRSLKEAKTLAETGKRRNVGITVETRPDWAKPQHINQMLNMGVTRVELGVQTLNDEIYEKVERGHKVVDVVEATRLLKDSGLKVCYHMMPGLPGSDFDKDLKVFKQIYSNSDFRPDMLKIYPCLVIKGTKLYGWWLNGLYKPYTTAEAVELLTEIKKVTPDWVRIMRIQRDIPNRLIEAGIDKGNLRELVKRRLDSLGLRCRCIRCREVGHRTLKEGLQPDLSRLELRTESYEASEGIEFFISVEEVENDVLIGYLRLRIPSSKAFRPEITCQPSALIRELRVCGPLVPVGEKLNGAWQHRGYGEALLSKAERIASDYNCKKILVTSALGVKRYYLRHGYSYDGPYLSKILGDEEDGRVEWV